VIGGKSWREFTAREWPAVALIIVLMLINLWGIVTISVYMTMMDALQFSGVPFVVGPILLVMRKIRISGLYMLLRNKKSGFGLYSGGSIAELISYFLLFSCDSALMVLALRLMNLAPFEMVVWAILVLIFAPIALWNLLSDCWESMK
jgi:hypothetical protein